MTNSRQHQPLDDLDRASLPKAPKAVADVLDEWRLRQHGITSGSHGVGLFLDLLADAGYTVALQMVPTPIVYVAEPDHLGEEGMTNPRGVPGYEGSVGPFKGQYGSPHVYARDVHSGAGNCVCGHHPGHQRHTEIAPGVPVPDWMRR